MACWETLQADAIYSSPKAALNYSPEEQESKMVAESQLCTPHPTLKCRTPQGIPPRLKTIQLGQSGTCGPHRQPLLEKWILVHFVPAE